MLNTNVPDTYSFIHRCLQFSKMANSTIFIILFSKNTAKILLLHS